MKYLKKLFYYLLILYGLVAVFYGVPFYFMPKYFGVTVSEIVAYVTSISYWVWIALVIATFWIYGSIVQRKNKRQKENIVWCAAYYRAILHVGSYLDDLPKTANDVENKKQKTDISTKKKLEDLYKNVLNLNLSDKERESIDLKCSVIYQDPILDLVKMMRTALDNGKSVEEFDFDEWIDLIPERYAHMEYKMPSAVVSMLDLAKSKMDELEERGMGEIRLFTLNSLMLTLKDTGSSITKNEKKFFDLVAGKLGFEKKSASDIWSTVENKKYTDGTKELTSSQTKKTTKDNKNISIDDIAKSILKD
tara:strand:+ start:287 stop:1204 length:918 start_codon:yes stop_codon:yes gene_type:complete